MTRIDDDTLAHHLEAALSTAPASLLAGLADTDRRRRHAAVGEIARQLVDRLCRFAISSEDAVFACRVQPALFPEDLGPIG